MMQAQSRPAIVHTADDLLLVHLPKLAIDYDRTWHQALTLGGPNTPSGSEICSVGELWPNSHLGIETVDVSLVNFGRSWDFREAAAYAKRRDLSFIDPRQAFAIGEAYPNLNTMLGLPCMTIVSLKTGMLAGQLRSACLHFALDERWAELRFPEVDWSGDDRWFGVVGAVES